MKLAGKPASYVIDKKTVTQTLTSFFSLTSKCHLNRGLRRIFSEFATKY